MCDLVSTLIRSLHM